MRQDMTSPLPPEVAEALDAVDRAVQGEALHWSMAETLREAFIAMSAKLEAAEGEVARLREDAEKWRAFVVRVDAEQAVAASEKFGDALGALSTPNAGGTRG